MAKKKAPKSRFPRNLYKKGGPLVWGKKENTYSTVLVEDEEQFEIATKEGYLDDFNEALFGEEEEVVQAEKAINEDDDF